jgi:hypothetical protein
MHFFLLQFSPINIPFIKEGLIACCHNLFTNALIVLRCDFKDHALLTKVKVKVNSSKKRNNVNKANLNMMWQHAKLFTEFVVG